MWLHKWSSLACTLQLLWLCLTGLPLIFAEEISHILTPSGPAATHAAGATSASLDAIVADGRRRAPGEAVVSLYLNPAEPLVRLYLAPDMLSARTNPTSVHWLDYDAIDGRLAGTSADFATAAALERLLVDLHSGWFAGVAGEIVLGLAGLLWVLATASGVAIYGPFMRKLAFGRIRDTNPVTRWLDFHNLLGAATLVWACTVGFTGLLNELAEPLFSRWQQADVAPLSSVPPSSAGADIPPKLALDAALMRVRHELAGMRVTGIDFPGGEYTTSRHFMFWSSGATPLTSRLMTPVLVDASTGEVAATLSMPWYLRAIEVSRPFHFGDYAGLPLKFLWAALDLAALALTIGGSLLWGRRWLGRRIRYD